MPVAVPELPRAGDSPVAASRPITVELPNRELNRRRVHELNAIDASHAPQLATPWKRLG